MDAQTTADADRGILVLDHHGIGNVVMSIPLLEALAATGRFSKLHVLFASPAHFEVVRGNALPIEPLYLGDHRGWRGMMRLRRRLAGRIGWLVGVPQVPSRVAAALRVILGAKRAVAERGGVAGLLLTHPVVKGRTKSILATQDDILRQLGIVATKQRPRVVLAPEEEARASTILESAGFASRRPVVGLHASSEKPYKRWPPKSFGGVCREVAAKHPDAVFLSFGSRRERADSEAARRELPPGTPWLDGTGAWSIRESAALLRRCDVLVSGDTGLMHLAAAVDTPVVAVFGPTSPDRLLPPGTFNAAFTPGTSCHPCFERPGFSQCRCIRLIDSAPVAEAVLARLPRQAR